MALNIAIKSKYNPFTYEDYIKPLEQYTKDFKEHETKIQDALVNIATLEPLIKDASLDTEENQKYIQQYNDYISSLENLTNTLYAEGFNRSTQGQGFLNTKKAYNSQILPLTEALTAMKKAHAEESKLESQGYILGSGAGNYSINDYYGMNTPQETRKLSLADVESNTQAIAANITKNMKANYSISRKAILNGSLDGYTTEKGINPLDYALSSDNLSVEDRNVIGLIKQQVQERILHDLGYTQEEYNKLDAATKNRINERIHTGLVKGLSYGEGITPKRKTSENGDEGTNHTGGRSLPYIFVSDLDFKKDYSKEAETRQPDEIFIDNLNTAISSNITRIKNSGNTVTKVTYGGIELPDWTVKQIENIYTSPNANKVLSITYTDSLGKEYNENYNIKRTTATAHTGD